MRICSMGTISDILEAVDRLSANDLQTLMEKLEDKRMPISKNVPNATTLKAIEDTNYETVSMDEFKAMCQ